MKIIAYAAALVLACAPVSVLGEELKPDMKTPDVKKPESKKERSEEKKEKKPEEKKERPKEKKEKEPETKTPWDIASGAALTSDYIFRGITQTAHNPSVAAYFEPRYNFNGGLQAYAGLSGESILFPNRAPGEMDFYGGIRPTFGRLALDL